MLKQNQCHNFLLNSCLECFCKLTDHFVTFFSVTTYWCLWSIILKLPQTRFLALSLSLSSNWHWVQVYESWMTGVLAKTLLLANYRSKLDFGIKENLVLNLRKVLGSLRTRNPAGPQECFGIQFCKALKCLSSLDCLSKQVGSAFFILSDLLESRLRLSLVSQINVL